MTAKLRLRLDRATGLSLSEQIRLGIAQAIESGLLAPGARLPSWRDLAAQLGVARGTVRVAYERLTDAQLIEASKATGTRVLGGRTRAAAPEPDVELDPLPLLYRNISATPYLFQMGVPAPDIFPTTLFARIRAGAVRTETASPASHPDPRGEPELRREIAAHLAISRGIVCRPAQVFITGGFSGGLGAALLALSIEGGSSAWVEEPGFPISRRALEIAGLKTVSIAVDDEGIDVAAAIRKAPDASLAMVTAGQQAPLGPTLSLARRTALLEWAARKKSWIIEDDYLGELQLNGRAAPALAAIDANGRVIHIGSFSKTISPTLRLGFVVVPPALAARFAETLSCLAPAPGPAVQKATASFMQEGHYMRHLRRLKRTYASRRDSLRASLQSSGYKLETAGLAMLLHLPAGTDDVAICRESKAFGIGPAPLSPWYSGRRPRSGLLLSVATAAPERIAPACIQLLELIRKFG